MHLISAYFVQESYPALHLFPYTIEKAKSKLVSFAGLSRKTCEMK